MSQESFFDAIDQLNAEIDKLQDLLVKIKQRVMGLGVHESDDQVRKLLDSQMLLCIGKLAELQNQYQELINTKTLAEPGS
ncbi:hypothetical protein [Xanthocytophaga flava]|uniref:hypothetical protein n=1 Tax=Xanthocytophaga flava TaxID=3048013 RepID=UPI0028D860FA|nr:hypothetical protein [Xanthocytophaga flavus]MDJ1468193.1 hypothetical protein [Xanthocytophaga flavus]